jgi:putative polymerase
MVARVIPARKKTCGMRRTLDVSSALPAFVLICAVCFNAVLAIINGHVVVLGRGHVIFAEIAIYAAALAIIVTNADRKMWPWFLLTLFIVLMGLLIGLGNGEFNPKYIRDVLVIPVFIMLGMAYQSESFTRPFLILHSIVLAVGLLEIASPAAYAEIFRILDYYVNTRDFAANSFWNTDSTLFVSATRPFARFFFFVDWHRGSSIFLEPVSLGNYCVVATILTMACWREWSVRTRAYLIGSTFFLLVSCDGRLAAISIITVLFTLIVLHKFSSRWSVFYLPATLIASAAYVRLVGQVESYDNFVGRVAGTMDALSSLDFSALIGLSARAAEAAADNGVVYFILSQSLIGLAVIWFAVCLLAPDRTLPSRVYMHAIGIFIPLNLLISYSFFSVKIAALIWFFYGYRFIRDLEMEPEPDQLASLHRFAAQKSRTAIDLSSTSLTINPMSSRCPRPDYRR